MYESSKPLAKNVKIIGFDESGTIQDPFIIFTQVEFNELNELDLFIHNLKESNNFLLKKQDIRGWDIKTKIRLARKLMDNDLIDVTFYKLTSLEKTKIYNDVFKHQARILFKERDYFIKSFKKISERHLADFISQLQHYRNYAFLPEFCVKSFAYLFICNQICSNSRMLNFLKGENNMIKIQVDGGYPLTFWWYQLFQTHTNNDLLKNKVFINGISHGDRYYLSMNIAHLLAQILQQDTTRYFELPIEKIEYNFSDLHFSENVFYDTIWSFLRKPFFKNRILFIGESELFELIPYILHQKNRRIVYEPFIIKDDIDNFFRYSRIGNPHNSIAIYSEKLLKQDKMNLKKCQRNNIETILITEYINDFIAFFKAIEEASGYYRTETQMKVKNILEKMETYFK